MLQEMKLLKGRLVGDLITGYRDLAGQQCVFKSWNWKLEWFSNRKMNPGFAGHSAVEVLAREKGRLWQIRLFKRWEGWVEKYMVSVCMCSTQAACHRDLQQKYQQSLDSSTLCNLILWSWVGDDLYLQFYFSTSRESMPLEANTPQKFTWTLN